MTYSDTEVIMEAGRNTLTGTEALDGIVDDLRWWNDPVEAAYWPTLVAAEQIDHQLAVYPFDHETAEDFGSYGRYLAVAPSASFTTGLYGNALVSGAAAVAPLVPSTSPTATGSPSAVGSALIPHPSAPLPRSWPSTTPWAALGSASW